MNQCINIHLHRECHKTSFIPCFIVTVKNHRPSQSQQSKGKAFGFYLNIYLQWLNTTTLVIAGDAAVVEVVSVVAIIL